MKYRQKKGSKPIPVLLDERLLSRIQAVSERIGEPKSTVMRIAMRLGLDGLENAMDEAGRINPKAIAAAAQKEQIGYPDPRGPAMALNEAETMMKNAADQAKRGKLPPGPRHPKETPSSDDRSGE